MAWAAKLIRAEKGQGFVTLDVEVSDGTTIYQRRYNTGQATLDQIKQLVRADVAKMKAVESSVIPIASGTMIDLTEPPPAPPVVPTAEEVERREWFTKLAQLEKLLRLVNDGLLPSTDTRISALQGILTAGWKNNYMAGL